VRDLGAGAREQDLHGFAADRGLAGQFGRGDRGAVRVLRLLGVVIDDLDVDAAMAAYERGLKIVAELQAYLKQAENKVTKLQAGK